MYFIITGGILFIAYRDKVYRYCIDTLINKTSNKLARKKSNKVIIVSICNVLLNKMYGIDPLTGLLANIITTMYFPENMYINAVVNGYNRGSTCGAIKNYLFKWIMDCNFTQLCLGKICPIIFKIKNDKPKIPEKDIKYLEEDGFIVLY